MGFQLVGYQLSAKFLLPVLDLVVAKSAAVQNLAIFNQGQAARRFILFGEPVIKTFEFGFVRCLRLACGKNARVSKIEGNSLILINMYNVCHSNLLTKSTGKIFGKAKKRVSRGYDYTALTACLH